MRIVQINTFPYKATGNIMMNIHHLLTEAGHDSYVVWGRGRKAISDHEIVIGDDFGVRLHGLYTRLTDKTGFASKIATRRLKTILEEIKPDIIHLHNVHGYYINLPILFNYIKENQIKVVWTLHDCWAFTGHCAFFDMCGCNKWKTGCGHCEQLKTYPSSIGKDNSSWNWKEKKKLFSGLEGVIVTPCNWLERLVKQSFLRDYSTHVIYNGIDRSIFKPTTECNLLKKYEFDKRPIILGVASEWTERKGLKDIIALAKRMPNYQFVVVGLTKEQKKKIPKTIRGLERTENVHELVALYSAASLFFNPTYEDNFPTTNIEALACGTPLLTYDTGGSPEAVISSKVGRVIKKDSTSKINIKLVAKNIEEMMSSLSDSELNRKDDMGESSENESIALMCREASKRFDKDMQLRKYIPLYESIMSEL